MAKENIQEVTRHIKPSTKEMLWGRSAGRCQFNGCNKILYKSSLTQESVNIAQKAHIYSFSENGPRGWGAFITNKKALNNIDNLMLMCHQCHKTIDEDKDGNKYSAKLLQQWKKEHEQRVQMATSIIPESRTTIVFYGSNIGSNRAIFNQDNAIFSIFPQRYPATEFPIEMSMKWQEEDKTPEFWSIEEKNLEKEFHTQILPKIEQSKLPVHFTLFAFADMPLLIKLGSLFSDIVEVDVRQLFRRPPGWSWQDYPQGFEFLVKEPTDTSGIPVLAFSISGKVTKERISPILKDKISIWEITVPEGHMYNDCIRNKKQLDDFITITRKTLEKILIAKGQDNPLHIFPIMSVSCSVELGRLRMPKVDIPWIIYDQPKNERKFIKTLTIGEQK